MVLSLLEISYKIRDFEVSFVHLWNILIHRFEEDWTLLVYAASPNKCLIEIKTCDTVTLDPSCSQPTISNRRQNPKTAVSNIAGKCFGG